MGYIMRPRLKTKQNKWRVLTSYGFLIYLKLFYAYTNVSMIISRYIYSHMLQSKQCLLITFMSGCYVTNGHKWGSFKHTCLLCPLAWGSKVWVWSFEFSASCPSKAGLKDFFSAEPFSGWEGYRSRIMCSCWHQVLTHCEPETFTWLHLSG